MDNNAFFIPDELYVLHNVNKKKNIK